MPGGIRDEIRQSKPFSSLEEEAYLNLIRTADHLSLEPARILKEADLSPAQYNVLRILRGAGTEGLSCRDISERMITRDPDVTRLLDRLEGRGLVARSRENKDRRVITVRIAPAGLAVIKPLDKPMAEVLRRQLRHLGPERLRALIEACEMARGGAQ